MSKKEEKCLVVEAREKCQCEWCKMNREWRDFAIKYETEEKMRQIFYDAMKEAGVLK